MQKYKSNFIFILLLFGVLILLCGCHSKRETVIDYMENRYHNEFTYTKKINSSYRDDIYTAQLSCEDYPGMKIIASYVDCDGVKLYADNYMAVVYYNEALEEIDDLVGTVIDDYDIYLDIPDFVMTIDNPEEYSLEDYLSDPLGYKSVYIISYDDIDNEIYQSLITVFKEKNIAVNGVLAVPKDKENIVKMDKTSIEDFLANEENVQTQINFKTEDSEVVREHWTVMSITQHLDEISS